jgi:hypothetical protein
MPLSVSSLVSCVGLLARVCRNEVMGRRGGPPSRSGNWGVRVCRVCTHIARYTVGVHHVRGGGEVGGQAKWPAVSCTWYTVGMHWICGVQCARWTVRTIMSLHLSVSSSVLCPLACVHDEVVVGRAAVQLHVRYRASLNLRLTGVGGGAPCHFRLLCGHRRYPHIRCGVG